MQATKQPHGCQRQTHHQQAYKCMVFRCLLPTFANPKAAFSKVRAYTAVRDSVEARASGSTRNAIMRMCW